MHTIHCLVHSNSNDSLRLNYLLDHRCDAVRSKGRHLPVLFLLLLLCTAFFQHNAANPCTLDVRDGGLQRAGLGRVGWLHDAGLHQKNDFRRA